MFDSDDDDVVDATYGADDDEDLERELGDLLDDDEEEDDLDIDDEDLDEDEDEDLDDDNDDDSDLED